MSLWGQALRFPKLVIPSSVTVRSLLPSAQDVASTMSVYTLHAPGHNDNGLSL